MIWVLWLGLILAGLGILILLAALVSPLEMLVSSRSQTYQINWLWLGRAWINPGESSKIGVSFGLWRWEKDLIEALATVSKKSGKKKEPKLSKTGKKRFGFDFSLIKGIFKTFEIKRFQADLDFGDPVFTAQAFSVIGAIPVLRRSVHLNFRGINQIELWVRNRLIFILLFILKTKIL
jgi:hypothetical protein